MFLFNLNSSLKPLQKIFSGTTTSSGNIVLSDFSEDNVIIEASILGSTYQKAQILKAQNHGTVFTISDIDDNRITNTQTTIKITYYPANTFE